MREHTRIYANKKRLTQLGGQMRLGGIFLGAASFGAMLVGVPASRPIMAFEGAMMGLGAYFATKVANDCFQAAKHPRNPILDARNRLQKVRPVIMGFMMMFGASYGTTMYDVSNKSPEQKQADTELRMPPQNADALLKNAKKIADPNCPRGRSTLTHDHTNKPVITYCTGAAP